MQAGFGSSGFGTPKPWSLPLVRARPGPTSKLPVGATGSALYRGVPEALPRQLGRFGRLERFGEGDRVRAVDSVTDHEAEIVRLPFGPGRRVERDAHVARLRDRSTVVAPSIRSVLDAGEWGDDDVFVALELLRGETPLATWAETADGPEKARAAAEILAGAALAEERGLALGPEVVVDDYGQPKILGLERDGEGDVAAARSKLLEAAAALLPPDRRAAITGGGAGALASARQELEREAKGRPGEPFAGDVARGEAQLREAGSSRQMLIGMALLFAIALGVAAFLVYAR